MAGQQQRAADAPSYISALAEADAERPRSPALIDRLREAARRARDLDAELADAEQRVKDIRSARHHHRTVVLPELMAEAGVPQISLAAEGNYPAVSVELKPEVTANIAADWEEEKRAAAFAYLDENGHGDLIKTTVVAQFHREDRAGALAAARLLREKFAGAEVVLSQSVHAMTLGAWLRELVARGATLPPLDVIGGSVLRVATVKPLKERR